MRPPSHPKVVPWDQLFSLLQKPLYIMYFRHMNREDFPKKPKSGTPAALRFRIIKIRFWGIFSYILAILLSRDPIQKRRPGLLQSQPEKSTKLV